jgi:hypothetical protein
MVFFELRWNYSPLKEKAVLLPDGLFICFVAALHTPLQCVCLFDLFLLLCEPLGGHGLTAWGVVDKICRFAVFWSTPIEVLPSHAQNFCS